MSLKLFFEPKSVAVIGASTDQDKLGFAILKNLIDCGYAKNGKLFPINPKALNILGFEVFPSVLSVPGDIDLAVIVIPYPLVPEALRSCGKKGIPAAIVISAGFREAGMEGVEREAELIEIAHQYSIRLIGPNCLGVIDTFSPLNASFAAGTPPAGPMAFMSQSGALGTAILDWAQAGTLGLSKFVSLGNKADVDEMDLLKLWADDQNANVIMIYSEGLPNGEEFLSVAREVSRKKPIVAIKSGVTQSGSRAVSSHTGSLAGSEQAYQAAFEQAGVLRANSMEDLFDVSLALGYQPLLRGNSIAIVTNAGGPGILATDALERSGLILANLSLESKQVLMKFLPGAASVTNPIDVLGDAREDRFAFAIKIALEDPNVDGLMVILTPQAMTDIIATAATIADLAQTTDKPILSCFMGEAKVQPGIDLLKSKGIPNYSFPERAARAFKAMSDYRQIKNRKPNTFKKFEVNKNLAAKVIETVRSEGRLTIGDAEAREIMVAYGLKIPKSELAETAEGAVEIANSIGYPVVLKIASPDILHKTDVGGVKVNIKTADEVRDAFDLMMYRVQRYIPDARVWGCLVQEMVPPKGLEILVGMNRDPQFGPLVTFGLGGIYVEILKDVTFRISPFSLEEAEDMIKEIRAKALLDGVRGQPPADKEAIIDTLLRVSQLVQDFPEITELDINPLMVYPQNQGAISIDMRMVLRS